MSTRFFSKPVNFGSILYSDATSVGTSGGTVNNPLKSYTLSGGTLENVGDMIIIEFVYTTAANANNKSVSITFGGSQILGGAVGGYNNQVLAGTTTIIKTGSNTQRIYSTSNLASSGSTPVEARGYLATSFTDTIDNVITTNGLNGTASANDIVNQVMLIRLIKK